MRARVDLLVAVGLGILTPAQGEMVTMTPHMDNTLYQTGDGSRSNGSGVHFFAGKNDDGAVRRGIVMFDVVSFVPAGASINSVTLRLRMTRTQAGNQNTGLHRVSSAWGEGTSNAGSSEDGTGAPSAGGDATWIHTFYSSDFWATVGGDYWPDASASASVGGEGFYTLGSTSMLVDDVQSWLDDPSGNHGWIVKVNEGAEQTAKRFATKEHGNAEWRPLLTIAFTPAPVAGDGDGDGDVDLLDFSMFLGCFTGPEGEGFPPECIAFDLDEDGDIDRADGGALQIAFTG